MPDEQKKKEFAAIAISLREELKDWYKEQVELDQAIAGAPASTGASATNVWNASTRWKSIQVIQSMVIVEAKLGFSIPENEMPNLVKEGGYANFEEMEKDLFPKLEKVYIAGGFETTKKEKAKVE